MFLRLFHCQLKRYGDSWWLPFVLLAVPRRRELPGGDACGTGDIHDTCGSPSISAVFLHVGSCICSTYVPMSFYVYVYKKLRTDNDNTSLNVLIYQKMMSLSSMISGKSQGLKLKVKDRLKPLGTVFLHLFCQILPDFDQQLVRCVRSTASLAES